MRLVPQSHRKRQPDFFIVALRPMVQHPAALMMVAGAHGLIAGHNMQLSEYNCQLMKRK